MKYKLRLKTKIYEGCKQRSRHFLKRFRKALWKKSCERVSGVPEDGAV